MDYSELQGDKHPAQIKIQGLKEYKAKIDAKNLIAGSIKGIMDSVEDLEILQVIIDNIQDNLDIIELNVAVLLKEKEL